TPGTRPVSLVRFRRTGEPTAQPEPQKNSPATGNIMPLFIVRHQHDADRCPAHDPYTGATLLNHLSRPNVRRHGITIQAEAVVRAEHTLYMIVESSDEARVRQYMEPFAMAGSLDIYPAATCAGVVSSGGCAMPGTPTDEPVPALNPEDACQQAI